MADIGKAPEGFPRRMQAARALAGLTIEELAERLEGERGLGERSLRSIEAGEHGAKIQDSRQRAILEACGLPETFATAPLPLIEPLMHGLESLPAELRAKERDDILIYHAFRFLGERPDETLAARVQELEGDIQRMRADLEHQIAEVTEALKRLGAPETPDRLPPAEDQPPDEPDEPESGTG